MAITGLQVLNPADKTKQQIEAQGTGAPAAGDAILDAKKFPIGSRYFDLTGKVLYIRAAASTPGVVGDWYKSAAFTQAT